MEEKIKNRRAVIIGGSAGSLQVILQLVKGVSRNLALPIIIVIHRRNDPNSGLINVLAQSSVLPVKEAEDKEFIRPGKIYLAPAGYHLLIEKDFSFSLDGSELVNYSRPSIDVSFQTAAEVYGSGLLAIVLSGANHDGTFGSEIVLKHKGTVIAQEPIEALVSVMPEQIIKMGYANEVCTTEAMIKLVREFDTNWGK